MLPGIAGVAGMVGEVGGEGNDVNTKLLLHFDNNASDSSAEGNDFTFVGDGAVSAAQFKFGTKSSYSDGTGDRAELTTIPANLKPGTGDFTIDFWVRFDNTSQENPMSWGATNSGGGGIFMRRLSSSQMDFYIVGSRKLISWSNSSGVWYHWALVRNGTTVRMYVDGVQIGTDMTNSTDIQCTGSTYLSVGGHNSASYEFTGYIDEFRYSDIARWTDTSFTVPTEAYG